MRRARSVFQLRAGTDARGGTKQTPNVQRRTSNLEIGRSDMTATFELSHEKLAADPRFARIARELNALSAINSRESFNRYCREACRLWNRAFPDGIGETEQFAKLLHQIEHTNDSVIRTGWGGVVITLHEHPRVEKYL